LVGFEFAVKVIIAVTIILTGQLKPKTLPAQNSAA
jgi:hypothetical protein